MSIIANFYLYSVYFASIQELTKQKRRCDSIFKVTWRQAINILKKVRLISLLYDDELQALRKGVDLFCHSNISDYLDKSLLEHAVGFPPVPDPKAHLLQHIKVIRL